MRLRLVCGPELEEPVSKLLSDRGLGPDLGAEIALVESGLGSDAPVELRFDGTRLEALIPLLDALSQRRVDALSSIAVRRDDRIELIPIKQVFYFETGEDGVRCLTGTGEGEIRERLYELEERLPASRFCRVSKSAIVNLGAVREVHPWFGRRLLLRFGAPGRQVEVTKNYVRVLKDRLGL